MFSLYPRGERLSHTFFGQINKMQSLGHIEGCLGRSMTVIWPGPGSLRSLDRVSLWPRLLPFECKD